MNRSTCCHVTRTPGTRIEELFDRTIVVIIAAMTVSVLLAAGSASADTNIAFSAKSTNNATVQPAGPRTGAFGKTFFNVEGSGSGASASFGVIDIDLSSFLFGGNPYTGVSSVSLTLTENNAAFTHPGSEEIYSTSATSVSIEPSPVVVKYQGQASGNNGTLSVDPLLPLDSNGGTPILLGTDTFTTTGNTNNGNQHHVTLTFTGAALTSFLNGLNSGSTLRLVLAPHDATTASTFSGYNNTTVGRPGPFITFTGALAGSNWDTNGAAAGLGSNGGSNSWDSSTPNFNDSTGTGTPFTYDPSKVAFFGGTGGAVSIGVGGITENGGLLFTSDGYSIGGNTLTLGTLPKIFVANATDTATISAKVSGSNGLIVGGLGTLALTNAGNDFSAGTAATAITVTSATLQIASDANLGSTSNGIVLNGGATLKVRPAADISLDANRAISGTGGTVDVGDGHTLTIPGVVTMGGPLTLPNTNETVSATNGTVAVGGLSFSSTGTFQAGVGGTGPMFLGGTTTMNATTGTATIKSSNIVFGRDTATGAANNLGATFSVPNAGATLALTGSFDTTLLGTATRIVVNGAGTIDLPHAQDANFAKAFQIGTAGAAGPTLNLYSEANMGGNATDQTFFNSGKLKNLSGVDLHFLNVVSFSLGGSGGFPDAFDGGGHTMTFDGAVSLFRPTTGQNQFSVTSGTTVNFAGGWRPIATNSIGDAGTLTNTSGFVVSGGGTLNLSGTLNTLAVPVEANGATVNINGTDSLNNGATFANGTATTTVNLQLAATNGGKLNLQAANAFAGSGGTPAPAKVLLGGGTLGTGGLAQSFGTLTVTSEGSALDVGSGAATASFADSSGATWGPSGPGALLRINNWTSGSSHITFAGTGLLPAQQTQTHFTTYLGTGTLSSGELVPSQTTTRVWRGDLDGSGKLSTSAVVPTGSDLTKLLAALADLSGYMNNTISGGNGFGAVLNTADLLDIADVNNDGAVNNLDIQAEIKNVINGTLPGPSPAAAAVPEPTTLALGMLGAVLASTIALRRRGKMPPIV